MREFETTCTGSPSLCCGDQVILDEAQPGYQDCVLHVRQHPGKTMASFTCRSVSEDNGHQNENSHEDVHVQAMNFVNAAVLVIFVSSLHYCLHYLWHRLISKKISDVAGTNWVAKSMVGGGGDSTTMLWEDSDTSSCITEPVSNLVSNYTPTCPGW